MLSVGSLNALRVLARDYLRWKKTGVLPWETEQEAQLRKLREGGTSKSVPPETTQPVPKS
jgi:hypothetical protein